LFCFVLFFIKIEILFFGKWYISDRMLHGGTILCLVEFAAHLSV